MTATTTPVLRRPDHPTPSEGLATRVKTFGVGQQQAFETCQQAADACATGWNAVHASVGSFADEHSTL